MVVQILTTLDRAKWEYTYIIRYNILLFVVIIEIILLQETFINKFKYLYNFEKCWYCFHKAIFFLQKFFIPSFFMTPPHLPPPPLFKGGGGGLEEIWKCKFPRCIIENQLIFVQRYVSVWSNGQVALSLILDGIKL